nr:reverse transcriptase domain-containing protein [Tanacetum cinerariifolium]
MRTRRSYFPPSNSIPRNSRRKSTSLVESDIQTNAKMTDDRTMAQMLQAPIEGYEDAIVVPPINANNFELKQTLINLVQSNQFTERQDPHNHLRFFNKCSQPEDSNESFQKLLEDLKEMTEYDKSTNKDRPIFLNDNEDHPVQNKESPENSSEETIVSNPNQEPPQDSDIHQLIEECSIKVPEEQKQNMKKTMIELIEICRHKHILCIHDDIDDLIESALNSKLVLINSNSQRLDKKDITPEKESDAEILLPIPSKCEVALEDKKECDLPISENSPVCDNHSDILFDSKIDDDISVYDDDFENIEYVEASLSDPEIVSIEEENGVEEENVVQQEEEEVDFEDISQIQDVVLREKLLSITRLISNIESLNDNSTPDRVLNSNSKLFAIIRKRQEVVTLLMLITLFPNMIRFAIKLSPVRRG